MLNSAQGRNLVKSVERKEPKLMLLAWWSRKFMLTGNEAGKFQYNQEVKGLA